VPKVTVSIVQGDALQIRGLGTDEAIDRGSTLHLQWVTINQENLPVRIPVDAGIQISYDLRHGYYVFQKLGVTCKEPVQAVEIRTLVFDVYGAAASLPYLPR
jgi:hypothetical protein